MSYPTSDLDALNKLKDAALWFIIIGILYFIGFFFALLIIVPLILYFVVGIPKLRNAFQAFLNLGKNVNLGSTGLNILIYGFIVAFIGGVLSFLVPFAGIALVGVGVLLIFLAQVLIGVALYNIGNSYNSSLMSIGGIIEIFLSFIGWILIYISIDEVINRFRGMPAQGPTTFGIPSYPSGPTYMPPAIYQVGTAYLKPNGELKVTLYSNVAGISIISATIEAFSITTTNISPSMLNQGNNQITILFPTVAGLSIGGNYTVALSLSNGQVVRVTTLYTNI
ncbi:hypothetical protein SUSAZ_00710 [Sulfolobus acidocaldarius SUSAZ]|nr:hypothetical protein SUSAZ_00710 [Sulfolobus acidocaldarius SUSAZ]